MIVVFNNDKFVELAVKIAGENKKSNKSNICLKEVEEITMAPLWHMVKVAKLNSKESFELLQKTINYLSCKGKHNYRFTSDEKEFMKELFEALWWGGKWHGYHEAATLANHYVNGKGKTLKIDSKVYKSSVIVSDAMIALKGYIKDQASLNKPIASLKTNDPGFLRSSHASPLKKQAGRSVNKQGYMFNDGLLLVEQSNLRLKNTDHRFYLKVNTTKTGKSFLSKWKVDSLYDFEPFSKGYVTHIPLANFTLKLPDGLSHHLTKIGVAQDFAYTSEWQDIWS